jgi:hypothetical protein
LERVILERSKSRSKLTIVPEYQANQPGVLSAQTSRVGGQITGLSHIDRVELMKYK